MTGFHKPYSDNINWMLFTPAHDMNFKTRIKRATLKELEFVLKEFKTMGGKITATKAVEIEIRIRKRKLKKLGIGFELF